MSEYRINGMTIDEYLDKKTTTLLRASVLLCAISFAIGIYVGIISNCGV